MEMLTFLFIFLTDLHSYKFVLTGGPCGGKTTGLARLLYFLKERGFECVNVAEAFTILASNGMSGDFFATGGMDVVIQNTVMDVQMSLEDGIERILRARGKPAVMLCDRGTMDGAAYMDRAQWQALLESRGTNETEIRDNRYNAVFHMVTAADGAEDHYTLVRTVIGTSVFICRCKKIWFLTVAAIHLPWPLL